MNDHNVIPPEEIALFAHGNPIYPLWDGYGHLFENNIKPVMSNLHHNSVQYSITLNIVTCAEVMVHKATTTWEF